MEDTLTRPRQSTFKRNAHITYFKRCLQALPAQATGHDSNRITIAYFCISGLDLLGALETVSSEDRSSWVDWVWSLQAPGGGFRGSSFMTTSNPSTSPGHLPSTYTAILALALLREPLDKLDLSGLESFLRSCQAEDGSFSPLPKQYIEGAFQSDLRMTYCATVIGHLTGFEGYDSDSALRMIEGSRTWEGGYASRQGVIEAQGGTTYCAIASRSLIDTLHTTQVHNESTIRWLAQRQIGGFQGRPGKLEDVCYSFWCGAALKILGADEIINKDEDKDFLLSAQSPMGGFGKEPEDYPDPYHSYLALAALALHQDPLVALKTLDAQLNIPEDTASWLRTEMDRIKSVES